MGVVNTRKERSGADRPGYPHRWRALAVTQLAGFMGLLLPLVQVESGGLGRLWWLFGLAPVLFALFLHWERWMHRRDRAPLLDTRPALVLRSAPPESAGWAVVLPLLVAGIGGGAVISPNITLTLECVPVEMAGAAAGVLQTGQRIGSAVGTAVLAAVFYSGVSRSGRYSDAVAAALLTAAGFVCVALLVAVLELRARPRRAAQREPDGPEVARADVHRA